MPGRRRFLVALVVDGDVALEINGLRRALGSSDIERIDPHLTLVAPLNVAEDDVDAVVSHLHGIARTTTAIETTLGPARCFAARDDVVYLEVQEDSGRLVQLSERLNGAPLAAPGHRRQRPFVAHVTLSSHLSAERSQATLISLVSYRVTVLFSSLTLLEQQIDVAGHPWQPVGQFDLLGQGHRGAGGRNLAFSWSEMLDPQAKVFFEGAWRGYIGDVYATETVQDRRFALVVRDAEAPVGVALGRVMNETWEIERVIVDATRRNEGLGGLLVREIEAQARVGHAERLRLIVRADSPARGFYARYGFIEQNTLAKWRRGRDFVLMERSLV